MGIFELIIIYLAVGAPFGVYYAATHAGETAFYNVAASFGNILLWPFVGAFLAYARLAPVTDPARALHISESLKNLLSHNIGPRERLVIEAAVDRYVALVDALEQPVGAPAASGMSLHGFLPNASAAWACESRANRERLSRHLTAARAELAALLSNAQSSDVAVDLARALNDGIGVDEFGAVATVSEEVRPISLAA